MPRANKIIVGLLVAGWLIMTTLPLAFAQQNENTGAGGDPGTPMEANFKGRCEQMGTGNYRDYPKCANSPNECASLVNGKYPLNCVFLEEPIGGKPGYDLYKVTCIPYYADAARAGTAAGGGASSASNMAGQSQQAIAGQMAGQSASEAAAAASPNTGGTGDAQRQSYNTICLYELWFGEALTGLEHGPIQAVLAFEPGKEEQGPFGLLYNYLQLIYEYMSGLIIAFVIFIGIIGGVMITTAADNQERATKGREMIVDALIGMAVWFLASVILYTINPTFFNF